MTPSTLVVSLALLAGDTPTDRLYDRIRAAQQCRPPESDSSRMDCDFNLGSLHFTIDAVGRRDGGISVLKADWDGEYHLSYGLLHGCVIVKWGARNLAHRSFEAVFISPATGGIYADWAECQKARPKKRTRSTRPDQRGR